jgi:hypothetical protein
MRTSIVLYDFYVFGFSSELSTVVQTVEGAADERSSKKTSAVAVKSDQASAEGTATARRLHTSGYL